MAKDVKNTNSFSSNRKDTTSIVSLKLGPKNINLQKEISWRTITVIGMIMACIALFPYTLTVPSFNVPTVGNVSKETIISPLTFDIMKTAEEIERDRNAAMKQILEVFDRDKSKHKIVYQKLLDLRIDILILNDSSTSDSLATQILIKLKRELSDNTLQTLTERPYLLDDAIFQAEQMLHTGIISILLVPSKQKLMELREEYSVNFENHMFYSKDYITLREDSLEQTVNYSNLPVKEIALEDIIKNLRVERMFDQEALNSLYELLDAYLLPNIMHNGEATQQRRLQASRSVLTTKGKVIKDSEIVRKHQEVSPEIAEKLRSLHQAIESKEHGQEKTRIFHTNIGKVLLVILFLLLIGYYIIDFHGFLLKNPKHLLALAIIIIFQLLIIRVSLLIVPRFFEASTDIGFVSQEFLIPTVTASILVAILFDLRLSAVVTLFISLYFGIALSFNLSFFIYSLLGGFFAGFACKRIRYRWDFFKAIPPIVAAYAVFVCIWCFLAYKFTLPAITLNISLSIINTIIAIFLAMMSVAIFEYFFDITTDMTLVELSDMNRPLLKRLSIEAAGTYNHSVLVANLAESAAEQINANPLLTRVASYYHDVGKIAKPNYFVENQKMEKNIHDKLAPSMSALIISSHIKEGLDLAKKYKLPSVIQSAIMQHHGDSTVSFFYEKALEKDLHKQVKKKDFCYPGPRPQTRENAVIMLADSVEAASRSLSSSTPKMVRALVKKIIHDKFASSQLDECNLTFQDLDKIIEGFMPVLHGIFHTRIEYPNKKQENTDGQK